jgi:hypothetical protein
MLEYKISVRDTSLRQILPDNTMIMYTNDTISRTENFTSSLGKQAMIRNMELDKAYILLETPIGKFAIQRPSMRDSIQTTSKYVLKKKWGKRKILGMKAKRLMVQHPSFEEPIEFLYLKNFSNKYLNNFEESPGLLVKFSVVTPDAVLDYELVRFNQHTPSRDLFGVPSDFQRVSLDEFVELMLQTEGTIDPNQD